MTDHFCPIDHIAIFKSIDYINQSIKYRKLIFYAVYFFI